MLNALRRHIALFGLRNAGKSTLMNALTRQDVSIVSETKGTTTDPVRKSIELFPLGPVVLIDTPGIDDTGALGSRRVQKAKDILRETDLALYVVNGQTGLTSLDRQFLSLLKEKKIPFVPVWNCVPGSLKAPQAFFPCRFFEEDSLKKLLSVMKTHLKDEAPRPLVRDLVSPFDNVVLVTPIDASAPAGRIILPQQQVIRELLDAGACPLVCQPEGLKNLMASLKHPPRLVITDSQAFSKVAKMLPDTQPLTSFSILFARKKGDLSRLLEGAGQIDALKDGDRVLISEGCTHRRQCGDIGTVKLPRLLNTYTGKDLDFAFTSGQGFASDLSSCRLIIHCGGCMLTETEMMSRIALASTSGVPITNYGLALAKMRGILKRSLLPLLSQ